MPPALSELFNLYPRDAIEESNTAPSVLGNLHIDNDGHRAIAMDHDSSDVNRVLKYWRKRSDGELRDFDCAFFTPHEIRAAAPDSDRSDTYKPFPKYVRHRRRGRQMKLNIGGTTRQIQMKSAADFKSAMYNPLLKPRVVEIVDARDHTELLKVLNSTSRPYAVCLLHVKQ